jgi:hypothetical protein
VQSIYKDAFAFIMYNYDSDFFLKEKVNFADFDIRTSEDG